MIGVAGLLFAITGTAVACLAKRFSAHHEAVATLAGILMLSGFALMGCALPVMI
jgi:hypothetical protein